MNAQAEAAQKQKNISAESLIDMLIITGKRLRECGEEEKAALQFKIAQKIMDAFAEDFVKLRDYLKEVTGVESTVYRFPGGSSNTVSAHDMWEYADYLEKCGVRFFDWNIASGDGGSVLLPVETLVKNATEDIPKNGTSVILLHDSGDKRTTVEALPIILENILAMEDTVILPITEDTEPVQHIHRQADDGARQTKE